MASEDSRHGPGLLKYGIMSMTIMGTYAVFVGVLNYIYMHDTVHNMEIALERVGDQCLLQSADLNNNGIPDKFYTIDDKIALVELDGKPVTDLLKK